MRKRGIVNKEMFWASLADASGYDAQFPQIADAADCQDCQIVVNLPLSPGPGLGKRPSLLIASRLVSEISG